MEEYGVSQIGKLGYYLLVYWSVGWLVSYN